MPIRHPQHWEERKTKTHPCHYMNKWLDLYANIVRKAGLMRIFPGGSLSVLDIGCGDGRMSQWIGEHFHCVVHGVDEIEWIGVRNRLDRFIQCDAEHMLLDRRYDLAICITSLPFMKDWRRCVADLCKYADRVLVIENLQTPVPVWQKGLPEKEPIDYPTLVEHFARCGYDVERSICINILDRRLFPKKWRFLEPLAFFITLIIDLVLSWVIPASTSKGRYMAVLFCLRK